MTDAPLPDTSPPAASSPPRLPGRVTAAALVLLVFGTLSALGSALGVLWWLLVLARMGGFGRFDDRFGDGFGAGFGSSGLFGFLFIALAVALAVAVAGGHLAAGWGILQRFQWARVVGLVVSGVGLLVFVVGILGSLVWVGTLPDFREFDRIPEWLTTWARDFMTAGFGLGVVVGLAVAAAYAFVLVVLARADEVFDEVGPGGQSSQTSP
jgi:hypothetical protein